MTDVDEARAPASPMTDATGFFISDGFVVPGLDPAPFSWWRKLSSRLFVLFMLLLVGPLALRLLWRGRAFGRGWKIALTVLTLAYTAGIVVETVIYFPRFVEWGRRIGEAMRQR